MPRPEWLCVFPYCTCRVFMNINFMARDIRGTGSVKDPG